MYTKLQNKETGEITKIQSQQHEVGCYVIIDDDPAQQHTTDDDEKVFHHRIRNDNKFRVLEKA